MKSYFIYYYTVSDFNFENANQCIELSPFVEYNCRMNAELLSLFEVGTADFSSKLTI